MIEKEIKIRARFKDSLRTKCLEAFVILTISVISTRKFCRGSVSHLKDSSGCCEGAES